ncbi:MAG: alpha/beta hydrolase [Leptospirales bacterium]|nr:alpha/beta hydrolase [Leptospirales bacterium]
MYLIVPGINGSGPEHWQTLWERADSSFVRVKQKDWDNPELDTWMEALNRAVEETPGSWIVAHSLGCLMIVSRKFAGAVKGAFLVAPPDPAGPEFPSVARSFADVEQGRLRFPTMIVASENDPYATIEFARRCATTWGSQFRSVGKKGHINSSSGLGFWQEGYDLFLKFTKDEGR